MKRTALRRTAPLTRHTRLRVMSKKRTKLAPLRRAFVARILAERPRCEVAWDGSRCLRNSEHVHEKLTRARGGSVLDPLNVLAVCGKCHGGLHAHPTKATEVGLLVSSWDTGTDA